MNISITFNGFRGRVWPVRARLYISLTIRTDFVGLFVSDHESPVSDDARYLAINWADDNPDYWGFHIGTHRELRTAF